jgi:uncharacterized protein YerC
MSPQEQITKEQNTQNESILRQASFDEMLTIMNKASSRGSRYIEYFNTASGHLRDNLKATKEIKQEALNFFIKELPPEAKKELVSELKNQQKKQEIQSVTDLTFKVEVHGILMENGIDFGEGPVSIRSMNDFGIGKYDSNSNKFELTYQEKELYLELQKEYKEKNLYSVSNFDYYADTLHATAGVMKIMKEGKSKEEAKQIVDDLRTVFGIKKLGRYDAKILIEQHNNTKIDSETGITRLIIDNTKEQTIFVSGHYEHNGAAYKIEGEDTRSNTTRKINGLKKEGKAQVWIYEESYGDEMFTTLQNFDLEMKNKKYNIVISAHGNSQEVLLGGEKIPPTERQKNEYYFNLDNMKQQSEFLESLKGRVDNIIILACSNKTDENINYLAKEFHERTGATTFAAGEEIYNVKFREKEPKIMFEYGKRMDGKYYGVQIYKGGERLGYLKNQSQYSDKELKPDYIDKL